MNATRDSNLQVLLDHAQAAISERADARIGKAAALIFGRLSERVGQALALPAERLPVCSHLEAIYSAMELDGGHLPAIASAFSALEPRLLWTRRKGSLPDGSNFYDGHANAMLIGPGGIEQRDDVWVGVTVMAPDVRYIDHSHPPEEIYLAFTQGEWWNAAMDWTEPEPGGLIYNPPGILHAMRSGEKPMLALWLLPT